MAAVNSDQLHSGLFILAIVLTVFLYQIVMFNVGKARGKYFNKEFMAQFNEEF